MNEFKAFLLPMELKKRIFPPEKIYDVDSTIKKFEIDGLRNYDNDNKDKENEDKFYFEIIKNRIEKA